MVGTRPPARYPAQPHATLLVVEKAVTTDTLLECCRSAALRVSKHVSKQPRAAEVAGKVRVAFVGRFVLKLSVCTLSQVYNM